MWSPERVLIDRLIARVPPGQAAHGPGLRLRLERLLDAADLQPPGLPPAAVLIVRRLAAVLPGPAGAADRLGQGDGQWEAAVCGALGDLWREAARPAAGPVPAAARAVRFADEAELVACLAADLQRGVAWQRWWWRAVLRSLSSYPGLPLLPLLQRWPELLPAVLDRLVELGAAAAVLGALPPAAAMLLLAELARTFDLPDWGVGFGQGEPAAGDGAEAGPPWRREGFAAQLPAGLGVERTALLGVGLSLHRRPALVRTPGFMGALRRWWAAAGATDRRAPLWVQPPAAGEGGWPAGASGERARAAGAGAPGVPAALPPPLSSPEPGTAGAAAAAVRPPDGSAGREASAVQRLAGPGLPAVAGRPDRGLALPGAAEPVGGAPPGLVAPPAARSAPGSAPVVAGSGAAVAPVPRLPVSDRAGLMRRGLQPPGQAPAAGGPAESAPAPGGEPAGEMAPPGLLASVGRLDLEATADQPGPTVSGEGRSGPGEGPQAAPSGSEPAAPDADNRPGAGGAASAGAFEPPAGENLSAMAEGADALPARSATPAAPGQGAPAALAAAGQPSPPVRGEPTGAGLPPAAAGQAPAPAAGYQPPAGVPGSGHRGAGAAGVGAVYAAGQGVGPAHGRAVPGAAAGPSAPGAAAPEAAADVAPVVPAASGQASGTAQGGWVPFAQLPATEQGGETERGEPGAAAGGHPAAAGGTGAASMGGGAATAGPGRAVGPVPVPAGRAPVPAAGYQPPAAPAGLQPVPSDQTSAVPTGARPGPGEPPHRAAAESADAASRPLPPGPAGPATPVSGVRTVRPADAWSPGEPTGSTPGLSAAGAPTDREPQAAPAGAAPGAQQPATGPAAAAPLSLSGADADVAAAGQQRPGVAAPTGQPGAGSAAGEARGSGPPSPTAARGPSPLPDGVDSDLAGLFYLINLMLRLDLPACFEPDWALASAVGPWGVLDALARGLLAQTGDQYTADVVWLALAALDGRDPAVPPGPGFAGADDFRLPPAWLPPDPAAAVTWTADAGRLRGWRQPGGLLLDLPRSAEPPTVQAAAELRPYLTPDGPEPVEAVLDPPACPDGPLTAGLSPGLRRWLALVLPSVRHRLRRALRLADDADPAPALLPVRGRLYVTSSHLDVAFRLDAISLPVRLAGLDRDPGWQRDFGRVIYFHFL